MLNDLQTAWVQRCSDDEQAYRRFRLMEELHWCDWNQEPRWYWRTTYGLLMEMKWACGRGRGA